MSPFSLFLILLLFQAIKGHQEKSSAAFDEDDERGSFWRAGGGISSSARNSHERRPPQVVQIFVPPRRPPPPQQSAPQPAQPAAPAAPAPAEQPNNDEEEELIAPADLTAEQRAARRRAYVQFLGQLEDAKSQMQGLDGKWGSRITENLVLLAEQQLRRLNGDVQGPEEADKIFLGDGPLNLRQIQAGQAAQQENELQSVGRFELDQLGVSEDVGQGQFRRVKRQQGGGGSGVTCQEFVFDSRQKWPQCAQVIDNIRDQSLCGDCWAVSASSSFSDRRCIQKVKQGMSVGNDDLFFSAYDTAICSDASTESDGCDGGSSALAWRWYTNSGVVSGGNNPAQNTSSGPQGGCKPYPFPPTGEADQGEYQALRTECGATCTNSQASSNNPPRAKARSWNYLYGANGWEEVMKNEIFENGSISASLMVFEDFKTYSSGVYSHVMGNQLGGHAIRLIGYGNITCSDGTSQKYWLGVNSWNTDWGLNGLFKIARGVDMCGIESRQIAYGIPVV